MRYKVLCGYIRQRWDCGDTVEIEEKHTGKYGAAGQVRQKRRKATPEEIKKHNQWKRERDVRRLIKWNFRERDYWITLTYPKGYKPTWEEMKDHAGKLVRKIREKYKKQGWILKYIYRLAIGSRGGRHIHILINREANEKTATDLIITDLWEQRWGHGHVNFRTLYSEGGYRQLAIYITKHLEKWESEELKRYHPSRNLIRKDPETEEIKRRSLVDRDGKSRPPKAPKGYYVDPESIETGKNPVTGYAYRHYTLVRIKKKE